ncbi:hypothetical protein [Luteolibacter sp. LG18]|uniref:WD40/YVTN/BNR-like repeat-containing protein n=1 Tax=Luteolibacter sp. LG18 TaxID=2819286 RepID=UPI002B281BFD|nr:hypothetical protein llg_42620 [Luteolibacter sp. LG18]
MSFLPARFPSVHRFLLRALGGAVFVLPLARGADYTWRNVAIGGGGYVAGIEYHPRQTGLAYVRTDVGGAYRRDKPNGPWIPLNDSIGGTRNEFMKLGVVSLALDPADSGRVYLACGQYTAWWAPNATFMASSDRGGTWTTKELPFKVGGNQDGRGTGERLAVNPFDGTRLLIGSSQDGLWRGTGRGADWERVPAFPVASTTFVRFHPSRAGIVYAGAAQTTGPSLWRSMDGGNSWAAVPGQPEGWIAHQTAFDGEGNLYVTFNDALGPSNVSKGGVWKLSPEGAWKDLQVPSGGGGFGGMATDPGAPGRVVVSTLDRWWPGDEIYRSDDGGQTWTGILAEATLDHGSAPWAASVKPHWITDVEIDPFDPGRVTFVTGYGLYTTQDPGVSAKKPAWSFDNKGLEESVPLGLVSPASGPPLISVIGDFDGFRHDDLDASPISGRHSPSHGTSYSLDGAGMAPGVLARLHESSGSVSRDGARTWKAFPSAPPGSNNGQIAVSADGAVLLLCPKEGVPYRSSDDGATWKPAAGCPAGKYRPAADRMNRLRLSVFDSVTRRVYRSDDGAATFTPAGGELPEGGQRLESVPGRAGHLWYAAGGNGLWRSADGGAKFHRAEVVEQAYQVGFGRPASTNAYPAAYLWGRIGGIDGIFRSEDGGTSWLRINDDRHQFGAIHAITGDPRVFGRVYLGTSGRGVIVGELGGQQAAAR